MGKIFMFNSKTEEDLEISLADSFTSIDQVPTNEKSTEAFIGFVNENKGVIQFLRYLDDEWLLDIPLQENETKNWTNTLLQFERISTALVKRIVETFFVDDNLIDKINSKYRLEETAEVIENITYIAIDPAFIQWIERHNDSDNEYS